MTRLLLTTIFLFNGLLAFGQKRIENKLTDQHQTIVGTKVSLIAPEGFTAGINFPGLQQEVSGASIMVSTVPGAFSEVTRGFTKGHLRGSGIEVEKIEKLSMNGLSATFISGVQQAQGLAYTKYTLAFGNDDETTIINGACPQILKSIGKEIKKSILTVYYDAEKVIDPFEALDYEIDVSETKLEFGESIALSLIFTTDGKVPTLAEDQTMLVVSKSFTEVAPENKMVFCVERLERTPLEIEDVAYAKEITINGLSGYEILANGKRKKTGDDQQIYQVILFSNGLYYILIGTTNDLSEVSIDEIKKAVATFRLK